LENGLLRFAIEQEAECRLDALFRRAFAAWEALAHFRRNGRVPEPS
jgi:hypothetical protein